MAMQPFDMSLAGDDYTPRSKAVAAQAAINLYYETIENKEEGQKGRAAMFGMPGRHVARVLTAIDAAATPVRGIWSGNGRLFVAAGTKYFELDSSYNLVGSVRTINDDATHTPVQFIANGNNQLLIVSAGVVYCDSGSGPVTISMTAASGTVDTLGLVATWVSGDLFTPSMVGATITISGSPYVVTGFYDSTHLVLATSPGTHSSLAYSITEPFGAVTGAFLGNYFIVNRNNVNVRQFNWSALNDGNSWDPLDYAQKESNPDPLRSVLVHNKQLYLFGYDTFEVWQNTVDTNGQPFQYVTGDNYGSSSPWGPCSIGGAVYFIGTDAAGGYCAYRLNGFTPERVSTYAEESQWNTAGFTAPCVSYGYREEGHTFWVINFGGQTWAFDTGQHRWTQLYLWSGSAFSEFLDRYHTFIPTWGSSGRHIVGGNFSATIYEASVNFYDDAGTDRAYRRDLPYNYANGGNNIYFGRMTLEMETGTVPSGAEPVVTRSRSDDRGETFTNPVTAGFGLAGNKSKRVYWPAGGASRDPVWRFQIVGQMKVALVRLDAELEIGLT